MNLLPRRAMVLAAGLGTRMRPITEHTPKPLIEVGGRTMLDRALDHLDAAGIDEVVVNVHHLADTVRAHLEARPDGPSVTISDETDELLETGGGVRKALPLLGPRSFYVLNADILWLNGARPALARLDQRWERDRMDALLLLKRTADAHGYEGRGDFFMDGEGKVRRRGEQDVAPFIYAGVALMTPEAFDGQPVEPFSLNRIFDRLLAAGRLFGIVHDGPWFHVGTPDAIAATERRLQALDSGADDETADYAVPAAGTPRG